MICMDRIQHIWFKPVVIFCVVLISFSAAGCLMARGLTWREMVINEMAPRLAIITTADLQSSIASRCVMSDTGDYTNKTIGGMDRIASLADRIRSQVDGTLLVSTGDDLMGAFYSVFGGIPEITSMNMAGYDVVVPGNHEFDQGVVVYAGAAVSADFDLVAANLDVSESVLKGMIKSCVLKNVGGVTVGIFGLITPELKSVCNVGDDVNVNGDLIDVASRMVAGLSRRGAKLIVALSHCGTALDRNVASHTPGLDIIVGGHSHEYLYETVTRPDGRPCIIVQAGAGGTKVGVLEFVFKGTLQSPKWKLVKLDSSVGSDAKIKNYVDSYMNRFNDMLSQPIGTTLTVLDSRKSAVREAENGLGDLITDAIADWFGSDDCSALSMINGGGIRGDRIFPVGNISRRDVLTILPFANTVVKVKMTGAELWQTLEVSASALVADNDGCNPENRVSSGGFLQLSRRFRVSMDISRAPFCAKYIGRNVEEIYNQGHRIVQVDILDKGDIWHPLDKDRVYTVYVNAWIASGGDGHYVFLSAEKEDSTVLVSDILAWYIKKNSPVNPVTHGRITIENY